MSFSPISDLQSRVSSAYEMVPFGESNFLNESRSSSVTEDEESECYLKRIINKEVQDCECYADVSFSSDTRRSFSSKWKYCELKSYLDGAYYYLVFKKTSPSSSLFFYNPIENLSSRITIHIANDLRKTVVACNNSWHQQENKMLSYSGKVIVHTLPKFSPINDSAISDNLIEKSPFIESDDCAYEIASISYRIIKNNEI